MSKITDYLLPTEKILWHKLPEPKVHGKVKANLRLILNGVILVLFVSLLIIYSAISRTTTLILNFYFFLMGVGLILIGLGVAPLISSFHAAKDIEYIITNQRVLIYPSPWAEKNQPKIINLYELNGEIKIKYNKATDTGDIYIPTPHWSRYGLGSNINVDAPFLGQSRMQILDKPIIYPDIKGIKEPYKVYDILVEAVATGKKTKWK